MRLTLILFLFIIYSSVSIAKVCISGPTSNIGWDGTYQKGFTGSLKTSFQGSEFIDFSFTKKSGKITGNGGTSKVVLMSESSLTKNFLEKAGGGTHVHWTLYPANQGLNLGFDTIIQMKSYFLAGPFTITTVYTCPDHLSKKPISYYLNL